jgi:phenylalanyl-tRNA synthetase beta chain
MTDVAIARLVYVLKSIDNSVQVVSSLSDVRNYEKKNIVIEISTDFIRTRIGANISDEFIVNTLVALGFKVENNGDKLLATVPSYRATKDISIKEDLVEEIARLYGYDNIVPAPLAFDTVPQELIKSIEYEYDTKLFLAQKYGANEIHSYLWNYDDFNKQHKINTKSYLSLLDSSNAGQSGIRSELLPTLLRTLDENKNNYEDIRVFEIGRVVSGLDEQNLAIENKKLAVLFASQKKSEQELFFEINSLCLLGRFLEEQNARNYKAFLSGTRNWGI